MLSKFFKGCAMLKIKSLVALSVMCALLGASSSFAKPSISGPQSGTLGPGTYIVVSDIQVLSGDTLVIVPGTEFLHSAHYTWEISGQLNAEGTEGDSINFVRQFPIEECRWGGVRFQGGASAASTIDYCIIDNCKNTAFNQHGGGFYINGVDLTISNTRISNCSSDYDGGGIYAFGATIVVDHCLIVDNIAPLADGGGIYLSNCSGTQILNSVIARNSSTGT